MPYATEQNIIDRYDMSVLLIVADVDNDGAVDSAKVDAALQDATDEIDAYIGAKYTLPLTSTPSSLVRVCIDIALYRLSPDGAYTEEKRIRYEDAIRFLKSVARGDASLGIDDASDVDGGTNDVEFDGPERQFSRSKMGRIT